MGMFDDLVPETSQQSAPIAGAKKGLFDDLMPHSAAAQPVETNDAGVETAAGLGRGLAKGVIGAPGLPGDIANLVGAAGDWARRKGYLPPIPADSVFAKKLPGSHDIIEAAKPYVPALQEQTPEGMPRLAETVGELVPLAGGSILKNAVIPGAAIHAAEKAAEENYLPSWAPLAAGPFAMLATHGAGAIANRPSSADRMVEASAKGMTADQVASTEKLFNDAQEAGLPLTRAEAAQAVTQGATGLGDLQRVTEGLGGLKPFFAQRAGQIERVGRDYLDTITPANMEPSQIGPRAAEAAKSIVEETPEGQRLSGSVWAAGPRTTAEQAGEVIQPELSKAMEGREGMRAALASPEYKAAENAPATIPMDGGFGFRDVTSHYEHPEPWPVTRDPKTGRMRRMTDDEIAFEKGIRPVHVNPLSRVPKGEEGAGRFRRMGEDEIATEQAAREEALNAKRQELQDKYNITERMPVIGLEPTKFGQVNVSNVARVLDAMQETAKGDIKGYLEKARKTLDARNGELDASVAGIHNARVALDDLISKATREGDNNAARQLLETKNALDKALETVPEYAHAVETYKNASKPLEPFEQSSLAKVTEKDQFNKGFELPKEQVPSAIEKGGASAAQAFSEVASPEARNAYVNHLATKILDDAGKEGLDLNSQSMRRYMAQHEDELRRFPELVDRLTEIANARDDLERLKVTPIGKLLGKQDVRDAANALFPQNPHPNSEAEIERAMAALAKTDPKTAKDLVRHYIETTFNQATRDLQSGPSQFGGATFAAKIGGNEQARRNIVAAVRAVSGSDVASGFERLIDIMQATGQRQRIGSQTSFNNELNRLMKEGNTPEEAAKIVAGLGAKWPERIKTKWDEWTKGRNVAEISRLLTDPKAAETFRRLALGIRNREATSALVKRLLITSLNSGAQSQSRREERAAIGKLRENGARTAPVTVKKPQDITPARARVDTEPSQAAIEAGNYRKGHVDFDGFKVTIENPKGSTRSGVDANGKPWETTLHNDYGYIKGSTGADKEHVDVYLGDHGPTGKAFVVDQKDPETGKFDEHKVVLGARSKGDAVRIYRRGFSDGSGRSRMGGLTELSADELRDWLDKGRRTKPISEIQASSGGSAQSSANREPIQKPYAQNDHAEFSYLRNRAVEAQNAMRELENRAKLTNDPTEANAYRRAHRSELLAAHVFNSAGGRLAKLTRQLNRIDAEGESGVSVEKRRADIRAEMTTIQNQARLRAKQLMEKAE